MMALAVVLVMLVVVLVMVAVVFFGIDIIVGDVVPKLM